MPLRTHHDRKVLHEEVEWVCQHPLLTADERAFNDLECLLIHYDRTTLRLYGDISRATIPQLESLIDSMLALQPESLIIDLSATNVVSEEVLERLQDLAATALVAVIIGSEVP